MSVYVYFIICFILGGIPFGLLVGFVFGKGDIRNQGSGNIGATNVWRAAGPAAAALTFIGDIGKGVAAVLLCYAFYHTGWPVSEPNAALIGGVIAVLGHVFSPFLGFRGGKGVNTALGVFITLLPIETLIAFAVFIVLVAAFRYISLGSMAGAVVLAAVLWIERYVMHRAIENLYLAAVTLLALLIIVMHRTNIIRLMHGNENRFHFSGAGR
jgi:glycerol-3-phosphate acyltransferase PlsY